MNEQLAQPVFRRGLAFASGLVCSLLGYGWVLFLPLCFSAPVPGDPHLRFVYSPRFLGIVWSIGLILAIAPPVAIWRRKFTVPWWMYPFFLVTFCVVFIFFILFCYDKQIGFTTTATPYRVP
jgi:hypothetical protein